MEYSFKVAMLELNDKFLDVMNEGFWFIEAYAPWCGHCKRLAPIWEHVGHALADQSPTVHVGKIDCTRFPSVASALKVHGYPTIIFFRNGVQIPYEGERKKETMVDFAIKSAGPVISQLTSTPVFHEMKKASAKNPFFIFFSKELEEGKQKSDLYTEFKASSEQLFTEVKFFIARFSSNFVPFTENEGISERIAVVKDGTHFFYDPTQGLTLTDWIQAERWSLVTIVSAANIYSVSKSTQKKLVLMLAEPTEIIENIDKNSESGK
ncbi:thioredoxin domain-containing protein [Ditylenchus destructor]|nr:thioredoxin domain-containing protein [Ditylenchus destructor]